MTDTVILHRYPYKESSLLLKCLSRTQGLVTLVARGVRSKSAKRAGALGPFARYHMEFQGRGEIKTLKHYEWLQSWPLQGMALYAGLYCNDLLLVFLPMGLDPENLFSVYLSLIQKLSEGLAPSSAVRVFESQLLHFLGLMPLLGEDCLGQPIQPDLHYHLESLASHPRPILIPHPNVQGVQGCYRGAELLKIEAQDFESCEVNITAKRLFQNALKEASGRAGFRSREVLKRVLAGGLA